MSIRKMNPSESPQVRLELVDLLGRIAELLEDTGELALVAGALLVARDGGHHAGRTADEDLDILVLGLGKDSLEDVLVDVALGTGPLLGRVVEDVESAEALGVVVLEGGELVLEKNVLLGNVAENESNLGLVVGVVEDGAEELVHGADTGAASNEGNVLVLVRLPRVLGERALDVEALAGSHVVEVGAHGTTLVLLDQEVDIALGTCSLRR